MQALSYGRSPVTVRCECGDVFEIGDRAYRRHRAQGTRARCAICRRAPIPVGSSSRFRNYWLKRYSQEWIVETAGLIWGTPKIEGVEDELD